MSRLRTDEPMSRRALARRVQRATARRPSIAAGGRLDRTAVLALQRSAGNRAVARLVAASPDEWPEGAGVELERREPPARCEPPYPVPPSARTWYRDPVLAKIRNDPVGANTQLIAGSSSRADVRRATRLIKQVLRAWDCEANGRDWLGGKPDGTFDERTRELLKHFQTMIWFPFGEPSLKADGIVGPMTMKWLDGCVDAHTRAAPRD